jgi:hypothetical protein
MSRFFRLAKIVSKQLSQESGVSFILHEPRAVDGVSRRSLISSSVETNAPKSQKRSRSTPSMPFFAPYTLPDAALITPASDELIAQVGPPD